MKKVSLLFLFLFIACGAQETSELTTGEEIYTARCSACHGENFEGRVGPALDAKSNSASMSNSYWLQTILNGKGSMPAVRITEEQAQLVINYIKESN